MELSKEKQKTIQEILGEIKSDAKKQYDQDILMYVTDYMDEDVVGDMRNLSRILNERIQFMKEAETLDEYDEIAYSDTATRIISLLSRLMESQKHKSDFIQEQIEARLN